MRCCNMHITNILTAMCTGSLHQNCTNVVRNKQALLLHLVPIVHPTAVAIGQVDAVSLQRRHQNGGCIIHPAVLDAMTHTAATMQSSQESEKGLTRIPVAFCALAVPPSQAIESRSYACHGHFTGLLKSGIAVTNFGMAAHTNVQLNGFQAKVAAGSKQLASTLRGSMDTEREAPKFYVVDFQAETSTPSSTQKITNGRCKRAWHAFCSNMSVKVVYNATAARSAQHVIAATILGMGLFQQHQMLARLTKVDLHLAGTPMPLSICSSSAGSSASVSASLAALAKAVSIECAAATITSSCQDAAMLADFLTAEDTFGTNTTGALKMRNKLLSKPVNATVLNSHIMPMPRGSLGNLKIVPIPQDVPGRAQVKVCIKLTQVVTSGTR